MKLSDFDYHLPQQLIAQKPVSPRDHSRLMVLDKKKKTIIHRHFYDLPDYLNKGDVLVLNNTKVFPARLMGHRKDTGGQVEVFLLRESGRGVWEVLIGNRRKKVGQVIQFGKGLECQIIKQIDASIWQVRFNQSGSRFDKLVEALGQIPLPPYIKSSEKKSKLQGQYQTVYAKTKGSVAAPTAGFHFTKPLLIKLKKKGVQIEYVTLHVGLGTFAPVKVNDIKKHQMHSEWASIDKKTAERLNQAKRQGHRIIAVGTTSSRTLESFAGKGKIKSGNQWTNIFIYPGYQFKFVDSMITNFHLPKSTLMMLISALAGRSFILKAYQEAVKKSYRFYSFGDAMFIT
ncbi:MAG: tRNA preQ1(34) S-adenosylmethionine ribosyltransferase-isomerase QueA [Candidatus Komeilibacteria bacterium]|nr:tRNA preQ1(34) S-adenosylmethionine ribosyltransferase-isomerase QueA [Candidatus Komeilibacteria bacterium]